MHITAFITAVAALAAGSQALPQAAHIEARTPSPTGGPAVPVPPTTNTIAGFRTMSRFGVCENSSDVTQLKHEDATGACVPFVPGIFGVKMELLSSKCEFRVYGTPSCAGKGLQLGASGCYSEPNGLWGYTFACPHE
ncbi:hypothetical protein B0H67DRAFT_555796 [Lasiosphaeris hirsuta]|uniref:Uncharacterized protein n=1 Tax=Lasiosphaeris hirsuta TaxID=260670 RepID=A0AA40DQK6_9PEZI|nr:hypothetical protein B0H67DRAFT_555796 [Lasiosphaeris hirsuta]